MRLDNERLRSLALVSGAVILAVAGFLTGLGLVGGASSFVAAQSGPAGPTVGPAPGAGGGGATMGGPGMMGAPGGAGPMMGMGGPGGMMGMGARGGAGGGGGGGTWDAGVPGMPPSSPIQDYEPNAASWSEQPQWADLLARYEVSMQWAREINVKWTPIRETQNHYSLAAIGVAATIPTECWGLTHPMEFHLEGRRAEARALEAYVRAQWDLVPDDVKANLKESARLAVLRKTRLAGTTEELAQSLADRAKAAAPAAAPGGAPPGGAEAGAGAAPAPAAGTPGGPGAPAGGPTPVVTPEDAKRFEQRVQEEYEYLMRVYLLGYDSAPWFRTAYDPQYRRAGADGRPELLDLSPPPYHGTKAGGGAQGATAARGGGGGFSGMRSGPSGAGPAGGPGAMGPMGMGMGMGSGGGGRGPAGRPGMGAGGGTSSSATTG